MYIVYYKHYKLMMVILYQGIRLQYNIICYVD